MEGRETPIDVLSKNLLLFGLTGEEKANRAAMRYNERYNAMGELETLEVELEEAHFFLSDLKEKELVDLEMDIVAFKTLEREGAMSVDTATVANSNAAPRHTGRD